MIYEQCNGTDDCLEVIHLRAEIAKLKEEGRKDYEGMREFQAKFIRADQERREYSQGMDRLRAELAPFLELDEFESKWQGKLVPDYM